MNILPYIAQATPYTTTYQTSGAVEGAAAAAFAVMMLFAVFIGYAITAIFLMLIFKKQAFQDGRHGCLFTITGSFLKLAANRDSGQYLALFRL